MHIIVPHTPTVIVIIIIIIITSLRYNQLFSPHSEGLIYVPAVHLLNIITLRDRMCQLLEIFFFLLMFSLVLSIVHLPSTLLAFQFSLGNYETVFCFMLVRSLKNCPPPLPSGCATEGNSVFSDIDVIRRQIITLGFYAYLLHGAESFLRS